MWMWCLNRVLPSALLLQNKQFEQTSPSVMVKDHSGSVCEIISDPHPYSFVSDTEKTHHVQ